MWKDANSCHGYSCIVQNLINSWEQTFQLKTPPMSLPWTTAHHGPLSSHFKVDQWIIIAPSASATVLTGRLYVEQLRFLWVWSRPVWESSALDFLEKQPVCCGMRKRRVLCSGNISFPKKAAVNILCGFHGKNVCILIRAPQVRLLKKGAALPFSLSLLAIPCQHME